VTIGHWIETARVNRASHLRKIRRGTRKWKAE
jgi:hypothetical protein